MLFARKKYRPREWWTMGTEDCMDKDFRALLSWDTYTQHMGAAALGWGHYSDGSPAPIFCDLATAPHVLIAGNPGSGKSVCINTILTSLLVKNWPTTLKLYIVDPKMVDYCQYEHLPHTRAYTTGIDDTAHMLRGLHAEMMDRYAEMRAQRRTSCTRAHIVLVFDECASLLCDSRGKKLILPTLQDIARLGRAAGIHLILATQYPTRDVFNTQLKANCPARISFRLPSAANSRVILDRSGAEQLRGKGDGYYIDSTGRCVRFQGHMTSREQQQQILQHWLQQAAPKPPEWNI